MIYKSTYSFIYNQVQSEGGEKVDLIAPLLLPMREPICVPVWGGVSRDLAEVAKCVKDFDA